MKIIITENKLTNLGIKLLNKDYSDLVPYENKNYREEIFFLKGNTVIFDYHKNSKNVFANKDIWGFLNSYFGMDKEQISNIIKLWFEENYNLEVKDSFVFRGVNFW